MNLLLVEQSCSEVAQAALDKQYYFGLIVGWGASFLSYWLINLPELTGSRKKMLSRMETLINRNDGIVTVTDLVVDAKVSPEKASKFLANFAQKLEAEVDVDDKTGVRFYRFVNAKQVVERLRQRIDSRD